MKIENCHSRYPSDMNSSSLNNDTYSPPAEDSLLADLTAPQREAVSHVDGPLLILAGPGSGKTRVITRRISYLVRSVGIPPWHILAITFTNKAAGEMHSRVSSLLTMKQARSVTIATFHSFCARLLRRYAEFIGLPPGYSIYDTADQKRSVKNALEDLEIHTRNFPPAGVLATISHAKNNLIDAGTFKSQAGDFYSRTIAKVYEKYEAILQRNHALDFDDLLLKTVVLLKQEKHVREELRDRFQYIMIDEYQDTNHAQFMIANALAAGHKNLCVTGDPDQSIYAWRGADIRNILDFETHYPDAKIVRLEQNYRSTRTILAAADSVIRHNRNRRNKALWTENQTGEPVTVVTCRDARQEAGWVTDHLRHLHDDMGTAWGKMAIFYRINSLSRIMEDTLRNAGIPYQIARGTSFYERKEIKDAAAYLRVIVNPADEVNLLRIINTPTRGISDKSIKALQAYAVANHKPMDWIIGNPDAVTALNTRARTSIARFGRMIDHWRKDSGFEPGDPAESDRSAERSLRGFVEQILRDSALEDYYRHDQSDPDHERLSNLGELVSSAQQFEDEFASDIQINSDNPSPSLQEKLLAFLERISLVSDIDSVDPDQGAVTLMTLHTAKGLEFPAVVIIGMEDGLLPHERGMKNDNELEEERRLCFVGITRAMQILALTHANTRIVFGQTQSCLPSRFLNELPTDVINQIDESAMHDFLEPDERSADLTHTVTGDGGDFIPGTLVRHPEFGLGRILTIATIGTHTRVKVKFNTSGVKNLILQFARLQKVV